MGVDVLAIRRLLTDVHVAHASPCTCSDGYGPVPPYCDGCNDRRAADIALRDHASVALPELLAVFEAACTLEDATARAVDVSPLQHALVRLCQAVRDAKP